MKIKRILFIAYALLLMPWSALADDTDCAMYKVSPVVALTTPKWTKEVVQPLKPMDLMHGNAVSTLAENYGLEAESFGLEDGYCVVLKKVDAAVGYTDFSVQIDSRNAPDSCAYNATMDHEDEHIRAHLAVVDDMQSQIKRAVSDAADSIMPVFIDYSIYDTTPVLDAMNKQIQDYPAVVLMRQKIKANEEIRDKQIDQDPATQKINECFGKPVKSPVASRPSSVGSTEVGAYGIRPDGMSGTGTRTVTGNIRPINQQTGPMGGMNASGAPITNGQIAATGSQYGKQISNALYGAQPNGAQPAAAQPSGAMPGTFTKTTTTMYGDQPAGSQTTTQYGTYGTPPDMPQIDPAILKKMQEMLNAQ